MIDRTATKPKIEANWIVFEEKVSLDRDDIIDILADVLDNLFGERVMTTVNSIDADMVKARAHAKQYMNTRPNCLLHVQDYIELESYDDLERFHEYKDYPITQLVVDIVDKRFPMLK